MTTNEFIKILQEADPEGNSHIRLDEGFPWFAELKEGYWDGAYEYLDKDGNFVLSHKGNKVDVHSYTIEDFVEEHFKYNSTFEDAILSKLRFELSYVFSEHRKEKENQLINKAKSFWELLVKSEENCRTNSLIKNLERQKKGWRFFQNKEHKGTYNWKFKDENEKFHSTSYFDVVSIHTSGKWEPIDNGEKEGFFEWVFKEE